MSAAAKQQAVSSAAQQQRALHIRQAPQPVLRQALPIQFDQPAGPHALVTASDGSQWYQVARGSDASSFYDAPYFSGSADEAAQVASFFPDAPEGTMLRSVGQGEIEAISPDGTSSMWYNSAMFEEPDAPHSIMESANGVDWYAMQPHAEAPGFESESSPAGSQPGMVNDFSAVEPASSVSGDGYSQPNVAGESVPAPENTDYMYTPAPFMDGQGTDSSGYSDSMGIPPDAPLDSPITDISLSDTGVPSHYTPGADVPDIGVEPQFGNTDVSLDIPQTGSGMPGSHDIGIIEPVSGGAPQYETADTGASVYVEPGVASPSQHSSPSGDGSEPEPGYPSEPAHLNPSPTSGNDSMDTAAAYNQALFQSFMPGYEQPVTAIDGSGRSEGHFEVRHADGSGTMFFDSTRYAEPRGDHKTFEDSSGGKWYAISGQPAVEHRPVYENGKPVYEGESVKTISVETVRYRNLPNKHASPAPRRQRDGKNPKKK